ncbi:hypothetical protein AB0H73_37335 [Streptomyces olivoreticuli]|uniref:hypothetical protein n=1 Tax=Streptomyces longwoodensis TaxID=68231 RepID=UPI0033CC4FEC
MTTTDARTAAPALSVLLEELRAAQPGGALAEQRHQFLDLDPDLVREDYSKPALVDGPAQPPATADPTGRGVT